MNLKNLLFFSLLFLTFSIFSQNSFEFKRIKIGDHIFQTIESPHPYPSAKKNELELVWQDYYFYPGASYIVFRFKNIDLAKGDWIEILNEDGKLIEKISENGQNFLSKMIFSEGAIINLYSKNTNNSNYGYLIDRITYGYPNALDIITSSNESFTAGICGQNDLKNAICYKNDFSDIYNKAKAVAKVIFDGSYVSGTAFLCSCKNHILTNYHVISDQTTLNKSHFIFNYEDSKCSSDDANLSGTIQCNGGTYIKGGYNNSQFIYDYSLIKLNNCDPQSSFGFIKLNKDMNVSSGHKFFIAGHPGGRGKEITYESDRSYSGICEIKNVSEYQCPPFDSYKAAYSFLCDVEGGSSGSPMISLTNYRAIGIAHCEGCPDENIGNKGVMLSKFISEIIPYLNDDFAECAYKYTISGKINGNSTSDISGVKIFVNGQQKALSNNDGTYETNPLDKGGHYLEPKKEENGYYCFNPKNTSVSIDYDDLKNVDFDILYYNIYGDVKIAFTTKPVNNIYVKLEGNSPGSYENRYGNNFNFSQRLCGDYTLDITAIGKSYISCPRNSFNLSYSNYSTTIYCALVVSGKIGPIKPLNTQVSVSGTATNGEPINQITTIDQLGIFKFYLPEGNYTFKPYSECNVFSPPLLTANVIYEKPISLDFTTTFWKICSSCYSTYFAREYECSILSGEEKNFCLSNAKIEFKNCAYLKTKDANSLLYNAIILSVEVKRAKGKPEEEIFEFNVDVEGDYFINLTNGNGLQKETALSSARVILDGEYEIFSPNDFNKNVFKLSKVVHLIPGLHNIKVQVESKPDAYITILVSDRDINSMFDLP